jgi:spore coat protein U-like protein
VSRRLAACLLALAPLAAPAAVCRIVSGGSLAFGSYDLLSNAPRDSQVNLTVSCSGSGTPQTVTLVVAVDPGLHGTPGGFRRMTHTEGTGDALAYNLYRDPARSSAFGMTPGVDTTPVTLSVPAAGASTALVTIYARIPPRQDPRIGSYSDAVQVIINY